jgi:glyoxylase-like metal-dependent hydrolase (beta-lactamase superfamily II)
MTSEWAEAGAHQVADGVHRIPLEMPQDGLRAINVYALETDNGLALIDGGWHRPSTHHELSAALTQIGYSPADIHDIYVTHVHRDHYTFAVELRRRHGSRIHLGRAEAPGIAAIARLNSNVPESSIRELHRAGDTVIAEQTHRTAIAEPFAPDDWEQPDIWLSPGPVDIAGHSLIATHTPGHTKGHMIFHDVDRGVCYTGDHVLPTITPSIGFELGNWELPLGQYLRSLTLMLDEPERVMLPAHGPAGTHVRARCLELLAHHDHRLNQTHNAVARLGPSTGLRVAQALRWTRRERAFGALDCFNQMVATCETLAHLDVLVDRDLLSVVTEDGVDVFSMS